MANTCAPAGAKTRRIPPVVVKHVKKIVWWFEKRERMDMHAEIPKYKRNTRISITRAAKHATPRKCTPRGRQNYLYERYMRYFV